MCFKFFFRKAINVPADHTYLGRLFHIRGPLTAKLLCPIVFFDIVTLRSVVLHADHKTRVGV